MILFINNNNKRIYYIVGTGCGLDDICYFDGILCDIWCMLFGGTIDDVAGITGSIENEKNVQ